MRRYIRARKRVDVSPGESVRIIHELRGLTRTRLSGACGIRRTPFPASRPGGSTWMSSAPSPCRGRVLPPGRAGPSPAGNSRFGGVAFHRMPHPLHGAA